VSEPAELPLAAPPAPPAGGGLSKASYARRRGCSAQYVSKCIRTGRLAPPAVLPDGTIDPEAADAQLAAGADPARRARVRPAASPAPAASGPAEAPVGAFAQAKTETEHLRRRKLELEIAETEGRLIPKALVETAIADTTMAARDHLLRLPLRGVSHAGLTQAQRTWLDAEIREALEKLAAGWDARASGLEQLAAPADAAAE